MEVYYCSRCQGRPWTRKIKSGAECPQCGSLLKIEDVSEESLTGRAELHFSGGHPDISDIAGMIKHRGEKPDNIWKTQFNIRDGEIFYEYLGFEKTGSVDFTVRFILGNQPDENAVINSTPFVSPKIKFVQNIELTELELMRKSFEREFVSQGFEQDQRLFHAFVKRGDELVTKTLTGGYENETSGAEDRFSERYFINYDYQQFGNMDISTPFRKDHGIFTEVKRVLDSRSEKFMDYMIFRARNGDNMSLNSFADDSSVLFDDPHISLIRYDRLLKEAQTTRM